MTPDEYCQQKAAATTDPFEETDSQRKERIAGALQKGGHSVGLLGDGINERPL